MNNNRSNRWLLRIILILLCLTTACVPSYMNVPKSRVIFTYAMFALMISAVYLIFIVKNYFQISSYFGEIAKHFRSRTFYFWIFPFMRFTHNNHHFELEYNSRWGCFLTLHFSRKRKSRIIIFGRRPIGPVPFCKPFLTGNKDIDSSYYFYSNFINEAHTYLNSSSRLNCIKEIFHRDWSISFMNRVIIDRKLLKIGPIVSLDIESLKTAIKLLAPFEE